MKNKVRTENIQAFRSRTQPCHFPHTHSLLLRCVTRWGRWEMLFPVYQLAVWFPQGSFQLVDACLMLQQHVLWFIQKLWSERDERIFTACFIRLWVRISGSAADKNSQWLNKTRTNDQQGLQLTRASSTFKLNTLVLFTPGINICHVVLS